MALSPGHSPSSPATWLKAYPLGVAFEMPQAAQSVERFHAMQLFAKATDQLRCEKRQALTATNYVWLKREQLDPNTSQLRMTRAYAMSEAMRDNYSCSDRKSVSEALRRLRSWMMHSSVSKMKTNGEDPQEGVGRYPQLVGLKVDQRDPGGPQLAHPIHQESRKGI